MNSIDRPAGPSLLLAEFSAHLSYDSLPGEVVSHTKAHLLDTVGVCLGGVSTPHVAIVADLAGARASGSGITVMGHSFRAELDDAIFANAVMGHSIDFDDSHKPASASPSMAAACAASE
jgi:2-methylcitrate dehydratase PrpD